MLFPPYCASCSGVGSGCSHKNSMSGQISSRLVKGAPVVRFPSPASRRLPISWFTPSHLDQHEDSSSSWTEQRVPNQNHQIPNGGGGSRRIRHRVSIIQNVVGREIFEQIAE